MSVVKNRHGENLVTQAKLGLDAIQLKAIKLMLKNLNVIYRFAGVANVTRKNSVKEHSCQLLKLADFLAETLDKEEDKQDLRLMALIHDFGEIAGEVTVANDTFKGNKVTADRAKEAFETNVFTIFMNLAIIAAKDDNTNIFDGHLAVLRDAVDNSTDMINDTQEIRDKMGDKVKIQKEFNRLHQVYTGTKNKMLPIFLKTIDRAEGTNYFCEYGEDLDLLTKDYVQKAIEYNMSSLYTKLPKDLGGKEDYINTFKKAKTVIKAAVRRFKDLTRRDKLSLIDRLYSYLNDSLGRYVTWGPDEYVYYMKGWTLLDMFKVFTGEFKVYKKLSEVYDA